MKRKFIFLYLETGAGHKASARALAEVMQKNFPDVEIEIVNGFNKQNYFGKIAFEKGYNYACNYVHGAFPLIYDLAEHRSFQNVFIKLLQRKTTAFLKRLILEKKPTDIVSFHFALTPFVKRALDELKLNIHFTVMVTDPFTVPKVWFYESGLRYFVYSERAKKFAVDECGVPEKNVRVVPFLLAEKYQQKLPTLDEVKRLKEKHGFSLDKKIVLLVGGGEGLPGAIKIINECILHRANFSVAVVCGRDKAMQKTLTLLQKTYSRLDLHVFGFVNYLDELVKLSDCVVTKAGPATLLEIVSARKPVIIIKYIHNQELGNMQFIVRNRVGFFIRKPGAVYKKINELLNDDHFEKKAQKHFDSLAIDFDSSKTAQLLMDLEVTDL